MILVYNSNGPVILKEYIYKEEYYLNNTKDILSSMNC